MSTSSNTTSEFDVNHNGEFKLNPLTYQDGSVLNIHVFQMDFEDMVSYLKGKIPRGFTTLYYMLPPYYTLSARQSIVSKLQREIQAEETLAHQLLCNLTRYSEEMRIREVQITMLQSMPTTSLNSYGLHALLMTLEADIRTTNNILRTRQQLLRSISAKQNFINSYMAL
ncbi:hypothetical protein Tco_0737594 [Tanacetum coccineum]